MLILQQHNRSALVTGFEANTGLKDCASLIPATSGACEFDSIFLHIPSNTGLKAVKGSGSVPEFVKSSVILL